MDIVFVSPEVFPFARAGGLGDVSYYLPLSLADLGHRIKVITPKYRQIEEAGYPLAVKAEEIHVPLAWREKSAQVFSTSVREGLEVFFIGCDELYNRAGLYGNEFGDYEDNAERYIFFSRAVLECIRELDLSPDVIHCHDWPTGLVPVYVKTLYRTLPNLQKTSTLYTFHNLGWQGRFWHYDFTMTGLDWGLFTPDGLEFHGQFNMTKGGLVFADLISTVSRKYAREVLTPEYGYGLEGVLQARKNDIYSVLNGVDYKVWNPAHDPDIAANYTPETLARKAVCRKDLAEIFDLPLDNRPVAAVISRLLDRKGFDLISAAFDKILQIDLKIAVMGMGEDKYHVLLTDLARAYPDRIGVKIAYEKSLAHRIMAGADMFLMPSRYEPCGLEQLYGLKYGTVPIVRATGGLDDTIIDVGEDGIRGTGFKFSEYTPEAMCRALTRAVEFFADRSAWEKLMRRGMAQDFSWSRAAAEYEKIYEKALVKLG